MRLRHVPIQITTLRRRLITVVTLKAWQARVNAPMPRHTAAPRKLLPAEVALVGLLVHVHGAQVHHQRVLARKGLLAAVALEDLGRVRELVRAQHAVAGKRLAAGVALIGSHVLVLVLMGF